MKWGVLIILLVACSGSVIADELQAYVDQPATISTVCIRNGQMRSNATVRIVIYDEQGNVVVPTTTSVQGSNGTFSYTHVFTNVGKYATKETCDFGDLLADGSTAITVIKPMFGTMQVVPQGISQTDIDKLVVANWLLLLPNSTGAANSSIVTQNATCVVSDLFGATMSEIPSVSVVADQLSVAFVANSSNGFVESTNYQVVCDIYLSAGLKVNGVKTYVYVNPNKSFWQYLLQLVGLAQTTQAGVNQTQLLANQTLILTQAINQTVSNLSVVANVNVTQIIDGTPSVVMPDVDGYDIRPVYVRLQASIGSVLVSNTTCQLDVFSANNDSKIVNAASMSYIGESGLWVYSMNLTDVGSYLGVATCSGGQLGTYQLIATNNIVVSGGVVMQSVGG
jgi:hypothetical protein